MRIGILGNEWHVEVREGSSGAGSIEAPVLFLHGFSQDSSTWHPVLEHVSPELTAILVDLPGHGRSGKPRDPAAYRIERLTDGIEELRTALGIERWHVVGYSMGGRIALTYAVRHPERVASLLLESSSFGPRNAEARADAVATDEALATRLRESSAADFARWWAETPVLASQAELPEAARRAEATVRSANDPQVLADVVHGAGQGRMEDLFEAAGRLPMPVLYVVGSKDAKYSAIAREAHDSWDLDVRTLAAGHNVHLEQPQDYAAVMLQFIRHSDEESR